MRKEKESEKNTILFQGVKALNSEETSPLNYLFLLLSLFCFSSVEFQRHQKRPSTQSERGGGFSSCLLKTDPLLQLSQIWFSEQQVSKMYIRIFIFYCKEKLLCFHSNAPGHYNIYMLFAKQNKKNL